MPCLHNLCPCSGIKVSGGSSAFFNKSCESFNRTQREHCGFPKIATESTNQYYVYVSDGKDLRVLNCINSPSSGESRNSLRDHSSCNTVIHTNIQCSYALGAVTSQPVEESLVP